jgi:hypothetical protein
MEKKQATAKQKKAFRLRTETLHQLDSEQLRVVAGG